MNDRPLLGPRTGIGQYLAHLLGAWPDATSAKTRPRGVLRRADRILDGLESASTQLPPEPESIPPIALRPFSEMTPALGTRPGITMARRGYGLAAGLRTRAALARRPGVVFEPNHIPPAAISPLVSTIHDLSVLERPGDHPPHRVEAWRSGLERATTCARSFLCVSRATADAMQRVLGVDEDKLVVTPLASRFGDRPASWTPERVRRALGVPERYWLCLGTVEPRKNIGVLLDALRTLPKTERERTPLVIAGRPGWGDARFWSELLGRRAADDALCTGYVTDEQTAALIAGARGVLCPSFYEGFGLPVVESMSLGVACAISTAPSLVEVAGDAAPALDPADAEGWARAMTAMLDDDPARTAAGVRRASAFSWAETARRTDDALHAALPDSASHGSE